MKTSITISVRNRLIAIAAIFLISFCEAVAAGINLPQVAFFANSGVEKIIPETGGTFTVEVGLTGSYTNSSFVSSVNQTLRSSNWYWLSVTSFQTTATRTGVATFTVAPWSEKADFLFTLYDYAGDTNVPVRQLGDSDYWIENTQTRGVYYDKPESLILNNSISGATYTILKNGSVFSTVTGTGQSMTIPVSGPGTFTVDCPQQRVKGSMTLELYSFLSNIQIEPDYNPISLPPTSYSNVVFLNVVSGETIVRSEFEEMLQAYNSGAVSYWNNRIRLTVSSWSDSMIVLQYDCGPNTSSSAILQNTRIRTTAGMLTFMQPGGGSLRAFNVSAVSNISGTNGSVVLSGSEPGVEYRLTDQSGYPLRSMTGTGGQLTFENLTSCVYKVCAYTADATLMMNGEAAVVTRPAGTAKENSIRSVTYLDKDGCSGMTDIAYFDGIGGLEQTVEVHMSGLNLYVTGLGRDLVTPVYRDALRRSDARDYLPLVAQYHNGGKVANVMDAHGAFYQSQFGDAAAYSELNREAAPDGRPVSSIRPGSEYRTPSVKSTTFSYASNTASDAVTKWILNSAGGISKSGIYSTASLSKTVATDEDSRSVTIFANARGKILLERKSVSGNTTADTYYIYDSRDSLAWVLPPECVARVGALQSLSSESDLAQKYCYIYTYDAQGNILTYSRPGAGRIEYIYDQAGRLTAMQEEVMRADGKWRVMTYDAIGRLVGTREVTGWARGALEAALRSGGTSSLGQLTTLSETYYDTYPSFATAFKSQVGFNTSYDRRTTGLKTCERLAVDDGTDFRIKTYYYDAKGNVIQTIESDTKGTLRTTTEYSFTGNPVKSKENYILAGRTSGDVVERTWVYDVRDRLSKETARVNSGQGVTVTYSYDALGRPDGNTVSADGAAVTSSVMLDMQGRERTRTVVNAGAIVFNSELRYHNTKLTGAIGQYAGNISEWEWHRGNAGTKAYTFGYDGLSRLTANALFEGGTKTDRFAERNISYDLNGNITSATRIANSAATTIAASYSGNRRSGDSYDLNGNVTYDSQSGLTMQWNRYNLIQKVSAGGSVLVNYSYLADGTKVSALRSDGSGLSYQGSLTYTCAGGSPASLEGVTFPGGRFVATTDDAGTTTMTPMLYASDHLGSVRSVVNGLTGETVETNDYYPFGGKWNDGSSSDPTNRYRYNGKEEQAFFSSPYSDYGARQYSSASARWLAIDPLANKYYSISPYAFCANNPINCVDPDGRASGDPVREPDIRRNRASNLMGEGVRNYNGKYTNHQGFDYYAAQGTDVLSVLDGVVVATVLDEEGDYGRTLTIEHTDSQNNTVYSFYAHLDKVNVNVGESVTEGQVVAKSGITGNASNLKGQDQHLHFELRSRPENIKGLSSKLDPNIVVDTKFISQDPEVRPQTHVGIIKIYKDGTKEYKDVIR